MSLRSLHLHDAPSRYREPSILQRLGGLTQPLPCHLLRQRLQPLPCHAPNCVLVSLQCSLSLCSQILFCLRWVLYSTAGSQLPPSCPLFPSARTLTGVHRHTWDFPGRPPYHNDCLLPLAQICCSSSLGSVAGSCRGSLSGTAF